MGWSRNGHAHLASQLAAGQANTKSGRLWLPVQTFDEATAAANDTDLGRGDRVTTGGRLAHRSAGSHGSTGRRGHHYLDATNLQSHTHQRQPARA